MLDVLDGDLEYMFFVFVGVVVWMLEVDNGFFGVYVRGSCGGVMDEDVVGYIYFFEEGGVF